MTLSNIFIVLSILVYLIGTIPYLYHIFHGRVVPHAFSWTVWTVLSTINTVGLVSHTGLTYLSIAPIISTIVLFFGAIVGWFMIKKIKIMFFDYVCLFLAALVVGIVYFKGLSHAIIPSIIVDLLILAPTIRKLWDIPRSEDLLGWLGSGISKLFFICSLGTYAFSFDNIWWWYVVVVNLVVGLLIFYRTRYVENWINRIKNLFSLFALKKKLW
ncbi:hypothetical protein K2X92_04795 [Candidatus Gracilibacteria bacterium]|nr:hypothetical protein [Candidatus Gracilibacteria bacterium]